MDKQSETTMNFLFGHTTAETAKEVKDYPWGYKMRTSRFYWVESNKKGDRFCYHTIDPRNGRICDPKKDVYQTVLFMYENEEGHIKKRAFSFNCLLSELRDKIKRFSDMIPADKVNEVQRKNVLNEILNVVVIGIAYAKSKYTAERYTLLQQWSKETAKYLVNCNFADIATFPEMPEPDIE